MKMRLFIGLMLFDYKILILCVVYNQICMVTASNARDTEEHIHRRSMRQDGFTQIQSAKVKLYREDDEILHSFRNRRHIRDTLAQNSQVELHIEADDVRFEILLKHVHAQLDMNKDAKVVVVSNDNRDTFDNIESLDCIMSGRLKTKADDTAVFSFCDGLSGYFTNGPYTYRIETIEEEGHDVMLLARKEMIITNAIDDSDSHLRNITKQEGRQKRAVSDILNIETVVVLDKLYVAKMREAGVSDNETLRDLMELKFTGAQAEWSKANVLDYTITIEIKEIVIWEETEPDWYTPSKELGDTLFFICNGANSAGLWSDYDHIHLFTGQTGTDVSGKAYTKGICKAQEKCAVSTATSAAAYYIPAHEIGHSMGMSHDGDSGCSALPGIMGGRTIGWSTCSVNQLNYLMGLGTADCTKTKDIDSTSLFTLEPVWPGMKYSDDEICALRNGQGFVYKGTQNSCSGYRCINLDSTSPKYGISYKHTAPTDGRYCGEDMVCTTNQANYQCINVTDTGLDQSSITKVTGGWSAWGTETPCSRTCGTGVKLRRRTCNNPKPQNSAWCEGDTFKAELCNTQPCSDDNSDEAELIKQRAGETCSNWKANNKYSLIGKDSTNYLNTGVKAGNNGDDQCDVICDTVDGYTAVSSERHGIIPDGTPCTHSSLSSSFIESNNLPRKSGMYGSCIQGHCYLIGCDHVSSSAQMDGCGVCGGDNSTCRIVSDVYDTVLASKERAKIVRIEANATLIQVYFQYNTMALHFLELRTKDIQDGATLGQQVLNGFSNDDTRENPVNFAGTYWYFFWQKQFMYAEGPTDQAVEIILYNYGTKSNAGVTYEYSLPTADQMSTCSGTCENGGVWNSTTCSCDCANGFYGKTCDVTCNKVCKNGQSLASSGCKCDCQGNTYGTTCSCKYPFQGKDCQDCKVTSCQKGGVFNATACRCTCPKGDGSLDCSTPCENAGLATETCESNVAKGQCETKNENMEQKCYLSCGLCEPSDTTVAAPTTTATITTTASQTTSGSGSSSETTTSSSETTTRIRTGTCRARRQNGNR